MVKQNTNYPKVLIIGETFHRHSGGGVTLTNLFHDWPKSRLFNANEKDVFDQLEIDRCEQYYQFGTLENKYFLPYFIRKLYQNQVIRSEWVSRESSPVVELKPNKSNLFPFNRFKPFLRRLSQKISFLLVVFPILSRRYCSDSFLSWVAAVNPDYIYAQIPYLNALRLIRELTDRLKIPLCIHIMDDWPSIYNKPGIIHQHLNRKISQEFRELISRATLLLSISEGMSTAYKLRYEKVFKPYHNPIDLSVWEPYARKSTTINRNRIRVLYAGRTGLGVINSLVEVIKAVESLSEEGLPIELHLQSPKSNTELLERFINRGTVKFNPRVEYSELPKILSSYDILVLPYDFDKEGFRFIKYSMPTKASEFMISGVPILLYCQKNTHIFESASTNGWALPVGQRSETALKAAIRELVFNDDLRRKLSLSAINFSKNNFESKKIREDFLSEFY